jgi:hypothetical protein
MALLFLLLINNCHDAKVAIIWKMTSKLGKKRKSCKQPGGTRLCRWQDDGVSEGLSPLLNAF